MKAYSLNLRARVAATCQQPGRTIGAVDAQFSVSVSFVEKLLQRQRTSSSLAPRPLPGRVQPRRLGGLPALAASHTLDALRVWLAALGGPAGSPATMGWAVDWRRKKRASTPPNATPSG